MRHVTITQLPGIVRCVLTNGPTQQAQQSTEEFRLRQRTIDGSHIGGHLIHALHQVSLIRI